MTIKKGREDVTDVADRPQVVGFCSAKRKEPNNIKLLHELECHLPVCPVTASHCWNQIVLFILG